MSSFRKSLIRWKRKRRHWQDKFINFFQKSILLKCSLFWIRYFWLQYITEYNNVFINVFNKKYALKKKIYLYFLFGACSIPYTNTHLENCFPHFVTRWFIIFMLYAQYRNMNPLINEIQNNVFISGRISQ